MDEELIVKKLIEHDERFDKLEAIIATKDDIHDIKHILESIVTTVDKIREDQVFTIEWIKRLQNQVDDQQKIIDQQAEEIRQIKLHLKLA